MPVTLNQQMWTAESSAVRSFTARRVRLYLWLGAKLVTHARPVCLHLMATCG